MVENSNAPKITGDALDPMAYFQTISNSTAAGTVWWEHISDIGSDLTSFVADRIREDVKTQHELMHCSSLSEMQCIQANFVQKAINQYHDEAARLVELADRMNKELKFEPGS